MFVYNDIKVLGHKSAWLLRSLECDQKVQALGPGYKIVEFFAGWAAQLRKQAGIFGIGIMADLTEYKRERFGLSLTRTYLLRVYAYQKSHINVLGAYNQLRRFSRLWLDIGPPCSYVRP